MNNRFLNYKVAMMSLVLSLTLVIACNKNVDDPIPNTVILRTGPTIAAELAKKPEYSLLLATLNKVGLKDALSDSSKVFTIFAPDNNAIKSFISAFLGNPDITPTLPDAAFLPIIAAADPVTTVTLSRIVNYHILGGQAIKAAMIKEDFANTQYPTNFIFPEPNTNPLVRFSSFVSRRQNAAWVNNIPVTKPDLVIGSNGVVHGVPAVLLPPSKLLLDTISKDPDFEYLFTAIQRADSGRNVNIMQDSSFQFFMGNPLIAPAANFTVFAPNNQAFKDLIFGLVYQRAFAQTNNETLATTLANGALALGPNFLMTNNLTTEQVRGILAHHVIPSKRIFSVNFPQLDANFPTFYNGAVPSDKGLKIRSTLNAFGFGVALSVKGSAASPSDVAAEALPSPLGLVDRHAINGVFYKINKVLIPAPPPPPNP